MPYKYSHTQAGQPCHTAVRTWIPTWSTTLFPIACDRDDLMMSAPVNKSKKEKRILSKQKKSLALIRLLEMKVSILVDCRTLLGLTHVLLFRPPTHCGSVSFPVPLCIPTSRMDLCPCMHVPIHSHIHRNKLVESVQLWISEWMSTCVCVCKHCHRAQMCTMLFVCCLTSKQHARVSEGHVCRQNY